MSTSIPVRMRIGANFSRNPSITSSCSRNRSGDRPLAIVSRGEWSVSAQYSWPSAAAVAIISSIGADPSDQFECRCRSPRSAARTSPPPRSLAAARNSASASGSRPAHAWAITFAVLGPMPGSDCQLLAWPWRSRVGLVKAFDDVGGVAVRHDAPGVLAVAVLVVGDLPQRGYRIHDSTNPAEKHRKAADLARDQQGHRDLESPVLDFELVDGVAPQTVADVADDRRRRRRTRRPSPRSD